MKRYVILITFLCVAMGISPMVFSKSKKVKIKKIDSRVSRGDDVVSEVKESELERLDPHGGKELNLKSVVLSEHPECKVCHRVKEEKIVLNSDIPRRCALCHNSFPHSGVVEHRGKALCIDCHRPHRAILEKAALVESPSSPSFHISKPEPLLPEGLVIKKNPDPMLRKNCRECHPWK